MRPGRSVSPSILSVPHSPNAAAVAVVHTWDQRGQVVHTWDQRGQGSIGSGEAGSGQQGMRTGEVSQLG